MRAAIYARKSTDDNDRNEDNKSVTRQVERARAYAKRKGWTVDDEHVYVDDGISGAEFKNRPALLRLLNGLKDIDVIIMSELSRLGREQSQTSNVLANVYSKNVRVYFYLTDEELRFESAVDKFMVTAVSFAAELEREKASQRARDALERKAQKGCNTGGRVYGYDNHHVWSENAKGEKARSHTEYRINEREAEVIRAIYRMYADGHGVKTIALTLNGDPRHVAKSARYFGGQKPPSPWKGTGSWAPSSVRKILHNERYTGVIPFGKHRKKLDLANGTKKRVREREFLRVPAPHLRIVSDELWREVRERHAAEHRTYLERTDGQSWGRTGTGRESKYLLTGLARCGCCSANMVALGRPSGSGPTRRSIYYYGCSWHNNRGSTVCTNDHRRHIEVMDASVLDAIDQQVLQPEDITYVIERAMHSIAERRRERPDRPREIEAELKKVRRELGNLVRLAATGRAPKTILDEIAQRETHAETLERELAELRAPVETTELLTARFKKAVRERVGQFKDALRADVPEARQALRLLFAEPLAFDPVVVDGKKTFAFKGQTRVGAILDPIYLGVASPRGFAANSGGAPALIIISTARLPKRAPRALGARAA